MASLISYGIDTTQIFGDVSAEANTRTLTFIFVFNGAVTDTEEVLNNSNTPKFGDSNPYNSSLKARNVQAVSTENEAVWKIIVNYDATTLIIRSGYAYEVKDKQFPYEEPVVKSWTDESNSSKSVTVTNSVGDPFENPLVVKKFYPGITWWQIEAASQEYFFSSGKYQELIGSTNKSGLSVVGRRIEKYGAIIENIQKERYVYTPPNSTVSELRWKVQYTIKLQSGVESVANRGYEANGLPLNKAGTKTGKRRVRLSDLNGKNYGIDNVTYKSAEDKEVEFPVWLKRTDGTIADAPDFGEDTDSYYLSFLTHEPISWATKLNLATRRGESLTQ